MNTGIQKCVNWTEGRNISAIIGDINNLLSIKDRTIQQNIPKE